jgi:hypothetical protein
MKDMIIMPIINDFKNFTWRDFVSKGYALHAFVGYILTDIFNFYIPFLWIVLASLFLIAVLYEILMNIFKKYKPDWADARWTLYGSILNFIVHFVFP